LYEFGLGRNLGYTFEGRLSTVWRLRCGCQKKLENVAIANALQLEAARRRAVIIPFSFVASAKFELAQSIRCRLRAVLLLIRYVTL